MSVLHPQGLTHRICLLLIEHYSNNACWLSTNWLPRAASSSQPAHHSQLITASSSQPTDQPAEPRLCCCPAHHRVYQAFLWSPKLGGRAYQYTMESLRRRLGLLAAGHLTAMVQR